MILIDSSVWIDRFADRATLQTVAVDRFLADGQTLLVGDLILTEILQSARDDRHAERLRSILDVFAPLTIVDRDLAIGAARNYRILRAHGVTVRKTIDTLIATRCILDGLPLLYGDREFDPFVQHLGLISAMAIPPE